MIGQPKERRSRPSRSVPILFLRISFSITALLYGTMRDNARLLYGFTVIFAALP
jgi:hypothetical protein